MNETFPVLYILVRLDLGSMNAGKGMAQSSHASNAFVYGELKRWADHPIKTGWEKFKMFLGLKKFVDDDFLKWVNETPQGFGTVLVLGVNEHQMRFAVGAAKRYGLPAEIVHDPSYPILVDRDLTRYMTNSVDDTLEPFEIPNFPSGFQNPTWYDGFVTVPMDTCAYVFADKNDPITGMLLGGYKLHP